MTDTPATHRREKPAPANHSKLIRELRRTKKAANETAEDIRKVLQPHAELFTRRKPA